MTMLSSFCMGGCKQSAELSKMSRSDLVRSPRLEGFRAPRDTFLRRTIGPGNYWYRDCTVRASCGKPDSKAFLHAVILWSMAEARAAYRSLFRSLSKHVSSDTGSKWHIYARKEFDSLAKVGDPGAMQQALQTAKDYADLICSIESHKVGYVTPKFTQ